MINTEIKVKPEFLFKDANDVRLSYPKRLIMRIQSLFENANTFRTKKIKLFSTLPKRISDTPDMNTLTSKVADFAKNQLQYGGSFKEIMKSLLSEKNYSVDGSYGEKIKTELNSKISLYYETQATEAVKIYKANLATYNKKNEEKKPKTQQTPSSPGVSTSNDSREASQSLSKSTSTSSELIDQYQTEIDTTSSESEEIKGLSLSPLQGYGTMLKQVTFLSLGKDKRSALEALDKLTDEAKQAIIDSLDEITKNALQK